MILEIRHAGIVVEDLEKSLSFYRDKLGFSIVKRMVEKGEFIDQILGFQKLEIITVKMALQNGQMIELLDYGAHKKEVAPKAINDSGLTHLALTVENLESVYKQFTADNINFISKPKISPDKYAKVAFCAAPEGTYIELVEVLT